MKILPLKTMRVKSPHFNEGILINQNMFDPSIHVEVTDEKPTRKRSKPAPTPQQEEE